MNARFTSIVAAVAFLSCAASLPAAEIGKPAPAFTLNDQQGKAVNLSDYAGKYVVLEWFNYDCPFALKHYKTGSMNATAAKYAAKGVVWLTINSSNFATAATNAAAAKKWEINRPVLDDHSGKVGHLYDATNTPNLYVIDPKGLLIYKGAIDSVDSADSEDIAGATNYVAKALDDALAGKKISLSETTPYGCSVKYTGVR